MGEENNLEKRIQLVYQTTAESSGMFHNDGLISNTLVFDSEDKTETIPYDLKQLEYTGMCITDGLSEAAYRYICGCPIHKTKRKKRRKSFKKALMANGWTRNAAQMVIDTIAIFHGSQSYANCIFPKWMIDD